MLIDEEELNSRIESPNNLMNRLNLLTRPPLPKKPEVPETIDNVFVNGRKVIDIIKPDTHITDRSFSSEKKATSPCLPPTVDEVVDKLEEKITIGSIKGKALGLMSSALDELKNKLPEVNKPERLAKIASDMSKVYDSVEQRNNPAQSAAAQIIIYAPQIVSEDHFNVIDLQDR